MLWNCGASDGPLSRGTAQGGEGGGGVPSRLSECAGGSFRACVHVRLSGRESSTRGWGWVGVPTRWGGAGVGGAGSKECESREGGGLLGFPGQPGGQSFGRGERWDSTQKRCFCPWASLPRGRRRCSTRGSTTAMTSGLEPTNMIPTSCQTPAPNVAVRSTRGVGGGR